VPLGEPHKDILSKYGAYVRSLAVQVRKQFGGRLDLDDLVAYGNIGLLEAADRFDTKFGANFLTFAHYRIKGAIYDGLRKMGTLKGPDLSKIYVGERTTQFLQNKADQEVGSNKPAPSADDDSREIAVAVESLAAIFAASLEGMENLQVKDESLGPDERLEQEQLKSLVRKAVDKLPENEQKLLVAYYYEGKTLQESGEVIGQSKSWASRLHARAIEKLKDFLAEERAAQANSTGPKKKENSHGGNSRRAGRPAGPAGQPEGGAADQAAGLQVRRGDGAEGPADPGGQPGAAGGGRAEGTGR
jgi:RNA polymerase sigma factor for flagellar operon FliA